MIPPLPDYNVIRLVKSKHDCVGHGTDIGLQSNPVLAATDQDRARSQPLWLNRLGQTRHAESLMSCGAGHEDGGMTDGMQDYIDAEADEIACNEYLYEHDDECRRQVDRDVSENQARVGTWHRSAPQEAAPLSGTLRL